MEVEEIVNILSSVDNKHYVLRRNILPISTIAKGFKKYIIELWDINIDHPLFSCFTTGQFTDSNKEALKKEAEKKFVEKLINYCHGVQ